ncbi:hypothetical protein [Desulfuromonas sp. TF]|uniref:hypothetical protein n=1 Tax=Desulfuromonas sp. TF TaxID=1232410 RepID=UPI0004182C71|nr:hypothetical protein [Desulfuromonas sp. TF]
MGKPYQVKLEQLTEKERDYMFNVFFPRMEELARIAYERRQAAEEAKRNESKL